MSDEIDKTPSGCVEILKGPDGKLREYVRLVDHEELISRVTAKVSGQHAVKETATKLPEITETRDAAPAAAVERRTFPVTEVRVVRDDAGKPTKLTGYAAVFDSPSVRMRTKKGTEFVERIAPGAFKNAIANNPDVRFLVGHEPNKILARTIAQTLTIREDVKGLAFEADLADTQLARDTAADVEHGNVRGMSFGFDNPKDEWSKGDDGTPVRTLTDVPIGEISATGYPAYPATSVDVRSVDVALQRLAEGKDPGTTEERCGGYGYGGGDASDIRSACRSAQMSCRDAHDSMEHALHTLATRKNAPNEHELRSVRDMMTHARAMGKKFGELRDIVKGVGAGGDENDPPAASTGEPDVTVQPGGSLDSPDGPRSVDPLLLKALRLGVSAEVARAVLPAPAVETADAK